MGSKKFRCFVVWLAFWVFFPSPFVCVRGQNSSDRDNLDSVVRDSAFRRIGSGRIRSGVLYDNISLPEKFSDVQVSVVRMRSSGLWLRGANFSFFDVPPRTLPRPFSRRIIIVYQNLANLSSVYYNVPNYTFVAPVVGLLAYDSHFSFNGTGNNNISSTSSIELKPMKDLILIRFSQILLIPAATYNQVTRKCVRLDTNGDVQFSNLTETDSCIALGGGHFSVVEPIQPPPNSKRRKHGFLRKWRKIVIGAGILGLGLGLVLFMGFGILLYKLMIKKKRIKKMERESEKNEGLDSIWVGTSRMPSATGIRTQPILENNYRP